MMEEKVREAAERAVDNLDCGSQLHLSEEQRETSIMNVEHAMCALVQETARRCLELVAAERSNSGIRVRAACNRLAVAIDTEFGKFLDASGVEGREGE